MTSEVKIIGGISILAVVLLVGLVSFGSTTSYDKITAKKSDTPLLVRPYSYKQGPDSAPVRLVEFADFQCPGCGAAYPQIKQLMSDYGDRIQLIHRNFPLSMHANAQLGARAAEAAGIQGKFWEMHDKLFENQNDWSAALKPTDKVLGYAKDLGLDTSKFKKDLNADAVVDHIATDMGDADALHLPGTPSIFINDTQFNDEPSYANLKARVDAVLTGAK